MSKIKKITFGQVRDIPANADETRTLSFILSTPTRDRHHTILNQANWNLDNYRKNPVIGYMHNLYGNMCNAPDPDDVVGVSKSIGVEDLDGALALVSEAMFEPASLNLQADKIYRKLLLGTLRATSVGFLDIGKGSWGTGDEAQEAANETFRFAGQELLEYSIVNIPSNPDGSKRANEAMRNQTTAAIMYAFRELGKNFRLSQIESMRVRDVLDLLDGKDIEIRETDPDKVRKMIMDEMAQKDVADIIEKQQIDFKKRVLAFVANVNN